MIEINGSGVRIESDSAFAAQCHQCHQCHQCPDIVLIFRCETLARSTVKAASGRSLLRMLGSRAAVGSGGESLGTTSLGHCENMREHRRIFAYLFALNLTKIYGHRCRMLKLHQSCGKPLDDKWFGKINWFVWYRARVKARSCSLA